MSRKRRPLSDFEGDVLTVGELAAVLGVGRNKAYVLARSGDLRVLKIGGSIRVPRNEVARFIEGEPPG